MKIAQSNVNLVSSNHYYEENTVSVKSGVVSRGAFLDNLQSQGKSVEEEKSEIAAMLKANRKMDIYESTWQYQMSGQMALGSENYDSLRPGMTELGKDLETSFVEQIAQIRARLLETLMSFLQILGGGGARRLDNSSEASSGNLLGDGFDSGNTENTSAWNIFGDVRSILSNSGMVRVTTIEMRHVEEEATSFSGQGIAKTEDGREIDFNVDFSLSRRLTKAAGISMPSAVNFIDPLVINVGSDVTSISDQSFFFDLDCDGVEEKVAGLGAGSGFLAYDRNGDGVVNDGSELFGTKSGDGFADLTEFDSDGNGWIDENDEAYGKLQVWLRDEDGTDRLLSLQEADVGAIFLGSVATEFTEYQGQGDNGYKPGSEEGQSVEVRNAFTPVAAGLTVAAMMRASGLFLKESGGVGTMHQIDLARL
ncbi:hypothetical protein [Butyrivibrio sp. XBB1001]|uniref:hypothetical protein n=1 Tax=Butyrivibrio sp. XBB1001 TaxID=1280682 RepID=UPI0004288A68|nr:hypothetical protein [Butyrivibrio sp. XBB1001]